MIIQKLPWAGIRVTCGETAVAIDPLFHFPSKFGHSHEPMYPLSDFGPVDAVLITHQHGDHFDPEAIAAFYGPSVPVYFPQESLPFIDGSKLNGIRGVSLGDTVQIGSIIATAAYSVDGVGDPQVSWVVEGDGKKLIHSGDTLWHGYWWKISKAHGPFDAACLPVNGAVVELPGLKPSGQPIVLTPEQAVAAAVVLNAGVLMPIHFRAIHHPPIYRETPNVLERLKASAEGKVRLAILQTNESLTL
ncbi:MBL fold metallo-hydrolase [Paenibacillus aceris]|uniref:L-ascorbate metabolism protein UlaG (Beta-lactamase superfamily) n=1 Tax=Paenibacillus aceris TaxID=869555 RepID=A0ABS4HY07_9BACL|nr:MBL fold metallo-hydrolase [Paenibacillus aceris]MBP1963559.1 L-ascorbate metabolism protein UlaG (beta-lactamase superfamily) [Paenibacillus aceris]NHW36823.1 MBL fold metallo-hydrolase [Paenibacillus aceris]